MKRPVVSGLVALLLGTALLSAAPPAAGPSLEDLPLRGPMGRGLFRGLASTDLGNVLLLTWEQRQMLEAIAEWYMEAFFLVVEHVQHPDLMIALLDLLEGIVDDWLAEVLTPEQLYLWDQFFPTGFGAECNRRPSGDATTTTPPPDSMSNGRRPPGRNR